VDAVVGDVEDARKVCTGGGVGEVGVVEAVEGEEEDVLVRGGGGGARAGVRCEQREAQRPCAT
jgi:hypothetical protein